MRLFVYYFLSILLCNFAYQNFSMKKILFPLVLTFFISILSCKDDSEARLQDIARNDKRNEQIFTKIDKAWNFDAPTTSADVQNIIGNWAEWRLFMTELEQKPKSTIGAFKQKAKTLSKKVTDLSNNIPSKFDKPEIRSRIMTLSTKIKSLDLYINLDKIPEDKVLKLFPEVKTEFTSLESHMEKIMTKSQIRLEEGEAEMIRALSDSAKKTSPKSPSATLNNGGQINPTKNPKANK